MNHPDELRRKLAEAGLESIAEQIVALTRPCYRVERSLKPEEQIPLGASKFGGSPDVPQGFEWPHVEGAKNSEAMEFVGQLCLSDLPAPVPEPMPQDGLLCFFKRWSESQVFYFPQGIELHRKPGPNPPVAAAPSGFWQRMKAELTRNPDPRQTYRACTLRFFHEISPPDGSSSLVKALNLSEEESEAYFEFYPETPAGGQSSDTTQHQIFGHARPVQNEMELECDFERRGGDMRWDLPPERFIAATREWILLLQVDTDDYKEGPGWMWGDAGMVYFWIHRDDLAARAFDQVVVVEQCH